MTCEQTNLNFDVLMNSVGFEHLNELPVEVTKVLPLKTGFLQNAVKMDIQRSYLQLPDDVNNVWKLFGRFHPPWPRWG